MKKTAQPTANGDLTAKARIRNAAFELYAAKGEANTSVREVAQVGRIFRVHTRDACIARFADLGGRAVRGHGIEGVSQQIDDVLLNRTVQSFLVDEVMHGPARGLHLRLAPPRGPTCLPRPWLHRAQKQHCGCGPWP